MKKCIVIGGGIIGLSTAYYLNRQGHQVTIIDKTDMASGASYVNAGYVAPSHFRPLAAPGMVSKGLKWMFDSSSPFYMKPRLDMEFFKWALSFFRVSNANHVNRSIRPIFDINMLSRELFKEIITETGFQTQFDEKGLMMYFQTQHGQKEEFEIAEQAQKEFGIVTKLVGKKEIANEFEPNIEMNILGGVYYPCDRQMTPGQFMQQMKTYLKDRGVEIKSGEEVKSFSGKENSITKVHTDGSSYEGDEFVLAAGAWTPQIAKKLNIPLLIQAGKGYRLDVQKHTGIRMPAVLVEKNMAVSPMDGFTRFAGTMELAGINSNIRSKRVQAIKNGAESFYKGLSISPEVLDKVDYGLRPVSFDGLPLIGRSSKLDNVLVASGHAMMGWGLGPATGKLITELVENKKTSINMEAFNPNR